MEHNTLIHTEQPISSAVNMMARNNSNEILLPTVKVKIMGPHNKELHVKAILDSASQTSLVTENVINQLNLNPKKSELEILGVSNSKNKTQYSVPLDIYSLTSPFKTSINCQVVENITCQLPQMKIDRSKLLIPPNIVLADEQFDTSSEISLLIAADVFFQVLLPSEQELQQPSQPSQPCQPAFINTKFGETITRFWKTESVPKTFDENLSEHQLAEEVFQNSVKLSEGKFTVDLPLKLPLEEVNDTLGSSFDLAFYRFLNLEKKLQSNSILQTDYKKFIHEYENSQIVLAWLKTEVTKLQAYVANRVQKIKQVLSPPWTWLYVNTHDNPADLLSRGISACKLPSCTLWWDGPSFLHSDKYRYKDDIKENNIPDNLPEIEPESINSEEAVTLLTRTTQADLYQSIDKFSDLNKKFVAKKGKR
ncbi:Uncharacterized protein OBRU01_10576 [Operophtera brumata]|uniref:Uncharacterized protein n=1 Tax=Operophtera brumata TaxID=104452 RepID=A0A0L7L9E2_OPEBR|nr:Uncharacterized protein OBRU01_10576 [Operophtera brumata]